MRERGFTKFFVLALFLVAAIAFSVTPSEAKRGKKHHKRHHYSNVEDASAVVVSFTGYVVKKRSGGIIDVDYPTRTIDLLNADDNIADLIFDEPLDEGRYRWIRLKVEAHKNVIDSYIEISGRQYSIWMPSSKRTGLKLVKGFRVSADGDADFGIKFNLRKSIRAPRGKGTNYVLKPTLKLVKRSDDDFDTDDADDSGDEVVVVVLPGSINGTISQSLIQTRIFNCFSTAGVYLFTGASVAPDEYDGVAPEPATVVLPTFDSAFNVYRYNFDSVAVGDYTVAFTCDAAKDVQGVDDAISFTGAVGNVSVVSGVASVFDF